jgi:hypothetical protein
MIRRKHIPACLTSALLAASLAGPCLSPAQQARFRPVQQQKRQTPPPRAQGPRQPGMQARPRGHAGDWLRRYKDVPAEEQERALQNDPEFRQLAPDRQARLKQRLRNFSDLQPQQQLRVLNRMETWEHLTDGQKQEARQLFGQVRQLPPARRAMVNTAVRHLGSMTPEQREQVINSDRFKDTFSDQEREIIRGASKLPLSPPEGEENVEPQEPENGAR